MSPKKYKVEVSKPVRAALKHFHPEIKRRMRDGIELIALNPKTGKTLQDELTDYRSLRVGKYRIIYKIKKTKIEIFSLGPRKTIYTETTKLLIKNK